MSRFNKYKEYILVYRKYKLSIIIVFLFLIINAIIILKLPFALNEVMDSLINFRTTSLKIFITKFGFFALLFLIQQVLNYISSLMVKKIGNNISAEICESVYNKVYFNVKKEIPQIDPGNTVVVLDSDCFSLGEEGIMLVYNVFYILVNIVGVFYFMWHTNAYLSIVITIVFVVLMIIQNKYNKSMEKITRDGREISGEYSYSIQEVANNFEEYRRCKAYKYLINKYRKVLKRLLNKRYELTNILYKSILCNGIASLINTSIVFIYGYFMLINNKLNLSNLITFNTYSSSFGGNLSQIPSLIMQIKEFKISYDRVYKILKVESFKKNNNFELNKKETIEMIHLENVSFSYNGQVNVLSNFNYKFKKGKIYGISGGNGTGKTTLLKVLSGEYGVTDGKIKINNKEVDLYKGRINFSEFLTYLSAQSVLFNDSILNNILIGKKVNSNNIKEVSSIVNISEWVNGLPNGFNTRIDDLNLNLSSGQKQKISIMRCLIEKSPILLLDEFEKHLDNKTKESILKYLQLIKKDKIILIVTHDKIVDSSCDINLEL